MVTEGDGKKERSDLTEVTEKCSTILSDLVRFCPLVYSRTKKGIIIFYRYNNRSGQWLQ